MPEDQVPAPEAPTPSDAASARPRRRGRGAVAPVLRLHLEHPVYFWFAVLAVLGGALGIGAVVAPDIVVDDFLWVNFWGPTEADINQRGTAERNGVEATEDYTFTSEIVYGLILAGALTSLYVHLFKKRGIAVDGPFIASLLPYVMFGPLARSMEDAAVFCKSGATAVRSCDPGVFAWLFISPFIYVLTAAAVIAHLLLAHAVRNLPRNERVQVNAAWLGVQAAAYIIVHYAFHDEFTVLVAPWAFLGLCAVSFAVYALATARGGAHQTWSLISWGLPMTLVPVVLITDWARGLEWVTHVKFVGGIGAIEHPEAPEIIPVAFGLTLAVIAIFVLLGLFLRRDAPDFAYFLTPLNIGLIGGHMLDAFATFGAICSRPDGAICSGATFLGVDAYGYGEKHPVSEFLLGLADGWGFPIMKLGLVVLIIILIDRSGKRGDEDPNLIGLVKLAVLVLGLGPGLRDVVRVAMGV